MNLQEILSYRDKCIICDRPLVMKVSRYPKLSIDVTDDGLKIKSAHPNGVYLFFKYDGTFDIGKRNYKVYNGPIHIIKRCMFHPQKSGPVTILKSRSLGLSTGTGTTMDNLKDLTCQYEFFLFGDAEGNYSGDLHTEWLYYHDEESFWQVNTWFGSDKTHIYSAKFLDRFSDMLQLKVPATNMRGVQTIQQLIGKIKMYTLFS